MNDIMKGMLIVLVILYVVSPLDLCPGPIDDIVVVLLAFAANKGGKLLKEEKWTSSNRLL